MRAHNSLNDNLHFDVEIANFLGIEFRQYEFEQVETVKAYRYANIFNMEEKTTTVIMQTITVNTYHF
jgi:hypothetical protein